MHDDFLSGLEPNHREYLKAPIEAMENDVLNWDVEINQTNMELSFVRQSITGDLNRLDNEMRDDMRKMMEGVVPSPAKSTWDKTA